MEEALNIHDAPCNSGSVSTSSEASQRHLHNQLKPKNEQTSAKKHGLHELKLHREIGLSYQVWDIAVMDNNAIALASKNRGLFLCKPPDYKMELICDIPTKKITALKENHLAAVKENHFIIVILDELGEILCTLDCIDDPYSIVATPDDQLIVQHKGKDGKYPNQLSTVDHRSNMVLSTIEVISIDDWKCSIACNSQGIIIIAFGWTNLEDTIIGVNSDGEIIFQYKRSDGYPLDGVWTTCIDRRDNIIIPCRENNKLHILNSQGQLMKLYNTENVSIERPHIVATDKQGHLIITNQVKGSKMFIVDYMHLE
ncbi:unnamed protein product [Owenia fusiformis]|uniref:Uncharacterized protein n=1 Tax=Owenia fusiformis TaxID=6347 RepID=A0A8J1UR98_OWEFU|nr:unnamed protein product [Owenia fusiformis]